MSGNRSTGGASRNSPSNSRDKKEHILVIRLSAMGDVAMLVPVLRVVTATYPHLKITVLTRKFFAPLFKGIPNVEVYDADVTGVHAGVIGLGKLAQELRDLEITAVADMHDVLRSNILKTVFCFYGLTVKQINKGRTEKKELTAFNNKVFKQLRSTHQRYADVFSHLRYPINLEDHSYPEKQKLSPNTREITGKDLKKWVGIAPYAQHDSKVYPEDLLMQVLEDLEKDPNMKIFLFGGGKAEKQKLDQIAGNYKNTISLAGRLTFEEELALISNLDIMLSMDSGNAHLAAMYGIPVVSLWGVTHPFAGFKPFGQPMENSLFPDLHKYPAIPTSIYGNKVPVGYEEVMRTIAPQKVVEKIKNPLLPVGKT
ncbi:glycosyltransferase family 9 protein [Antarcticibacterium flavum]|uniref:Glycosyltransferase family 9 protein n=1 Tax=Antarcticibacterium flavum TaxID=2058175 RepID=A0A5B7X4B9_9FLAO|nr:MULTISPECIES: glycosyltransferase family 9 protein [Antarcticibacterium]MCM4159194.1 ADP-heptose--LPS heptosyltransferase RfaF [Antarcticibacterium sp. W02-3]QCY69592.1 glycosyltransferase family 9 protein [Antarcticibacterium flavum]